MLDSVNVNLTTVVSNNFAVGEIIVTPRTCYVVKDIF